MSSLETRSRYRPEVRLGNWYEDIYLKQDKEKAFINQRDKGELLISKTQKIHDTLHREINLDAPMENVYFGASLQLIPVSFNVCNGPLQNLQPTLSISVNENAVRYSQFANEKCELTISGVRKPCVRNTFRIVSADDKNRNGQILKYGQQFRLECVEKGGNDGPLYLYTVQKSADLNTMITTTYDSRKFGELNLPLGLCLKKNCGPGKMVPINYTNWFCKHVDPFKRFESEGQPLLSNQPLVITHVATNRNLAAENIVIQTAFGPEFLVSVQCYKNIFKRETWKNVWMISNGHNE